MSASILGMQCVIERRAMGVVWILFHSIFSSYLDIRFAGFGIAPWNAPFGLTIRAIAALVVQLFHEAGLPIGVLNYISMSRESSPALTAHIIAHPLVRKINAATAWGCIIATEAAKQLKLTILELDGKALRLCIAPDYHPRRGQYDRLWCDAALGSNLHVHRARHRANEALIVQIKSLSAELPPGKDSESAKLGHEPVFTEGSADNVVAMISEAQAAGAEVLLDDLGCGKAAARQRGEAWRESFGPVIAIAVVDTPEDSE
ncbi:Aldehyde/histidinol dehydrogenase [Mycena rebaudengoi]|nr:Aldehyde/histidinol dehydrogenase [Mycena rebaudengoi]